jgi:hypothetical protein
MQERCEYNGQEVTQKEDGNTEKSRQIQWVRRCLREVKTERN